MITTERKIAQCSAFGVTLYLAHALGRRFIYCSSLLICINVAMLKRSTLSVCALDVFMYTCTFKREIMSCISLYLSPSQHDQIAMSPAASIYTLSLCRRADCKLLAISYLLLKSHSCTRNNCESAKVCSGEYENAFSVVVVVVVGCWWNGGNVKNMQIRQRATQRVKVSSFTRSF